MKHIEITEVGPRDGFQIIKEFIPMDLKIKIIENLIDTGLQKIQITSFAHPKAVPQMKDAVELSGRLLQKYSDKDVELSALIPNMYGAKAAVNVGFNTVSYVMSVSESHNKSNVNKTLSESIAEFTQIRETFPDTVLIAEIATAFGCPFEGLTPADKVFSIVERLISETGVKNFSICDTIGIATPTMVRELITGLLNISPGLKLEAHIHDTRNMGMVNSLVAIECGCSGIQSSVGGMGGCPFAPGASGNTSTEDLVYMLNGMGYETGVNFDRLLETARFVKENIDGNFSGHHINIKAGKQ